jgi:hypothetical protein
LGVNETVRHALQPDVNGLQQLAAYCGFMIRIVCLLITVLLSLPAVSVQAAPSHKRSTTRWHGYGFLPGYVQPPSNSQPLYGRKFARQRFAQRGIRPWYIDPVPVYFGYDGSWHYFGRPGFRGNRFNGGSLGPCWTRTPVGPIWNCGR